MLSSLVSRPRIRVLLLHVLVGILCSMAGSYLLFGNAMFARIESWWLSAPFCAADHADARHLQSRSRDVERMRTVLDEVRESCDQLDEHRQDLEAMRTYAEKELQQELKAMRPLLQLIESSGGAGLSAATRAELEQDLAAIMQRVQRYRDNIAKTETALAELKIQRHALERRLLTAEESFHDSSHELQQCRIQRTSRRAADKAQENIRKLEEIHRLSSQR